jgi:hypothetical protein
MGTDKKLLLKNLPEKLDGVVKADSSDTVINLWKVSYWFTCTCMLHVDAL